MKTFNKNLLWASITAVALTGCGGGSGGSGSSDGGGGDHEHSILVSQLGAETLSLLKEGELEDLHFDVNGTNKAAGEGATLILSETGAYAAVYTPDTNIVNFVHGLHDHDDEEGEDEGEDEGDHEEPHVLEHTVDGSQVITTNGHFAILDKTTGTTTFVEDHALEEKNPDTKPTSSLSASQTYPALMIDEGHDDEPDLVMVFAEGKATVYKGLESENSFDCKNPTSHGQIDGLVVVTCDESAIAVVIGEDDEGKDTFTRSTLTLAGNDEKYVWRAGGHVIVGFEPDTKNYAIIELEDDSVDVSNPFDFAENICDMQLDSEVQDILSMTLGGTFVALDHEGAELKSIEFDFSATSTCDDFIMAPAAQTAIVVDNSAQKGYELDVEDSSTTYHLHEDFDLDVSDITSMVIFHEKDHEDE